MKRLLAAALVLAMAFSLCACCIKHDMAPATCTEPSTCTKCGKTEGEPLGHTETTGEALAPTCTEPGLTAETYCTVCGEVFVPAEEIPATGHEWIPATYFDPKTCAVCGAVEGEPLGNKLFENAIDAFLLSAEASEKELPANTSEAADAVSDTDIQKTGAEITLKGSTFGLGDADSIISASSLIIRTDRTEDGTALTELEAVINGSGPVNAEISYKDGEVGLSLPGIDNHYYCFNLADFIGDITAAAKEAGIEFSADSSPAASMSKETFSIIKRYLLTVLSVADFSNMKETKGSYAFDSIEGEAENCRILSCTPDKNDWRTMIRKLAAEAKSDNELASLLEAALGQSYDSNYSYQFYYDSRDEYISESMLSFYDAVDEMLESSDEIAETLTGYTLEIAYCGKRIHALKFRNDINGGGYESFGDIGDGREDVIVLYSGNETAAFLRSNLSAGDVIKGTAVSDLFAFNLTYMLNGKASSGSPVFDIKLNAGDNQFSAAGTAAENGIAAVAGIDTEKFKGELDIKYENKELDLTIPSAEKTIIKDTDGFGEAFVSILTGLYQSGMFGSVADEAID